MAYGEEMHKIQLQVWSYKIYVDAYIIYLRFILYLFLVCLKISICQKYYDESMIERNSFNENKKNILMCILFVIVMTRGINTIINNNWCFQWVKKEMCVSLPSKSPHIRYAQEFYLQLLTERRKNTYVEITYNRWQKDVNAI